MKIEIYKDEKKKPKGAIKKTWSWIWHSDSILSWLVALALAFVVVKFIFFPFVSLILGTSLPLVVVESSSMEHPESLGGAILGGVTGGAIVDSGDFEKWWNEKGSWYEQRGISEKDAAEWPLKTGFDKGDIMIVYGRFQPEIGDVIIFNANTKHPIIHRIISIDNGVIQTKGDNNDGQLSVEQNISEDVLVGKAVIRIPKLGWVKLVFVEIFNIFSS